MIWFGDPEALDADARMLAADADAVRDRGRALVAAAASTAWAGPAADAFRHAVAADARDLDRAARELAEAARELHAHAAEVRARLARLRELADAAADRVGDAGDWIAERWEVLR